MKRITALLLCVLLMFALAACDTADTSNGSSGTPPQESAPVHTEQELYDIWHSLVGYWNAAEGLYAVLDMEDGHTAAFMEGVWAAGGGRGYGRIIEIAASGGEELTVTVLYPATEGTEMDEPLPETEVIVVVDYSGKERDGKIRMKTGDGEWREYTFAGNTSNEAYQTYLDNLPSPAPEMTAEQFDEIWTLLFGYWNAAEGRFAVFDAMDSNTAVFSDGIWGTGYERYGTVSRLSADYRSEHEDELTISVFYNAVEATEMQDAQPAKTETVVIDYSGLEQDGKIRIKIGGGEWCEYTFAGNTSSEAYQTYLDNLQSGLQVTEDTEEEQLASLWKRLKGCWGVDDRFVLFAYDGAGKPIFQSGTWQWRFPSNTRDPAVVTSITNFNGTTFTLSVSYLANEETAADEQDLREYHYTVMIGIEDLADGVVSVEAPEDTQRSYARLADSYEEAYEIANQGTW